MSLISDISSNSNDFISIDGFDSLYNAPDFTNGIELSIKNQNEREFVNTQFQNNKLNQNSIAPVLQGEITLEQLKHLYSTFPQVYVPLPPQTTSQRPIYPKPDSNMSSQIDTFQFYNPVALAQNTTSSTSSSSSSSSSSLTVSTASDPVLGKEAPKAGSMEELKAFVCSIMSHLHDGLLVPWLKARLAAKPKKITGVDDLVKWLLRFGIRRCKKFVPRNNEFLEAQFSITGQYTTLDNQTIENYLNEHKILEPKSKIAKPDDVKEVEKLKTLEKYEIGIWKDMVTDTEVDNYFKKIWGEIPPTISDKTEIGKFVVATIKSCLKFNGVPKWISTYRDGQKTELPPKLACVFRFVNRMITLISTRNRFMMTQPTVMWIATGISESCPKEVREAMTVIINESYEEIMAKPRKSQQVIDNYFKKKEPKTPLSLENLRREDQEN